MADSCWTYHYVYFYLFQETASVESGDQEREVAPQIEEGDADEGEVPQQDEGHADQRKKSYVDKHHLNNLLHPNLPLSRLDVLLMILHMALRHCHTQHFVEDMIMFVNSLFGQCVLDVSWHVFSTLFPSSSSIQFHYFCSSCEVIVDHSNEAKTARTMLCPDPECNKVIKINSVDSKDYFITLSVREQLENLLKRPDVKLVPKESRISNVNLITDLFNGELFATFSHPGFPLDFLTSIFNTDGAQVLETPGLGSLYPIWMYINEIVPEQRFKQENLILGGLWFGKGSPNMALFLKPFLNQLIDLSMTGVSVPQPGGGTIICPVFPVACSVDSVCKPKIMCQHQFNGSYSCLYCLHPNDAVTDASSTRKHFDTSVSYPLRTEESVIEDMAEADRLVMNGQLGKDTIRGFFGLSILLIFRKLLDRYPSNPFHIIWSVVIDYMHAVLEGVCGSLLEHYKSILSDVQLQIVNQRLDQITLPEGMSRKPRRLDENVKYKAKEYRSFFLYFAVPCFKDILPNQYFVNLSLFVNALHIFLSDSISSAALGEARICMRDFVTGYQRLFGLQSVTYNLHLCLHLADVVKWVGPLWAHSNFIFESGNGLLIRIVRGTRSVINEIAVKFTRHQSAAIVISENPVSDVALKFCNTIMGSKFSKGQTYGGVSVTGSQTFMAVSDEERQLLLDNQVPLPNGKVKVLNRVIRNGIKYLSKAYSKAKTTHDSCVILTNGSYAIIDKIVLNSQDSCLCLIRHIRIAASEGLQVRNIKVCSFDVFGGLSVIPFKEIKEKCVFLSFDDKHFVCHIPNFYERD